MLPGDAVLGFRPRAVKTYVRAEREKEKKGYASVRNSSTRNSKILEPKRPRRWGGRTDFGKAVSGMFLGREKEDAARPRRAAARTGLGRRRFHAV